MTSPTPTMGPCEAWDPIWCCDLTSDGAAALTGTAVQAATEILYNRSGQRFGLCTFTVRPCRENCNDFAGWAGGWWGTPGGWGGAGWGGGSGLWPMPALIGGNWYNLTCGGCSGTCSCTELSIALLPSPVASIVQVKLNGEVLAVSGYRVDNYRELVRLGGASWPICQDLTLADTEDNTWSVTYQVGEEVPTIGRLAVGELACLIMQACLGQACAIPYNATTVTRQGITIDFPSIYELLDRKLLGLYNADLFIATYNPHGLTARPRVYDVDAQINRRTTWP
jgi:hypothetical protein